MIEEMSKEENEKFAAVVLAPILSVVDLAVATYDIERLRATYEEMQSYQGTLVALPFPESQSKSESIKMANATFGAILNLIELRIKQRDTAKSNSAYNGVLKDLGLL